MVWYKVYANHGGGHQGYAEKYVYETTPLSEAGLRNLWDDMCRNMNNASGKVVVVKAPPQEYVRERIEHFERDMEYTKEQIKFWKKQLKPKGE